MCVLAWVCYYYSYKTLTQRNLRSRFISLYKSQVTVFHCGKSEKELKAGTEAGILTTLLLKACSEFFL